MHEKQMKILEFTSRPPAASADFLVRSQDDMANSTRESGTWAIHPPTADIYALSVSIYAKVCGLQPSPHHIGESQGMIQLQVFVKRTDNAPLLHSSKHNIWMTLRRGGKVVDRLVQPSYVVAGVVTVRKRERLALLVFLQVLWQCSTIECHHGHVWLIVLILYSYGVDQFFKRFCLGPGCCAEIHMRKMRFYKIWTTTSVGFKPQTCCWVTTDNLLSYSVSPEWNLNP